MTDNAGPQHVPPFFHDDLYWILKYRKPVMCNDIKKWAREFEKKGVRKVRHTMINHYRVSTVFLALKHGTNKNGDPLLFETAIFDDENDCEIVGRVSFWRTALHLHQLTVNELIIEIKKSRKS